MELYFCDLCHEAVPTDDISTRKASVVGERVTCKVCNLTMGGGSTKESVAFAESAGKQASPPRPAKRPPLVPPGVAAALAIASIGLTLFAVIVLLVRLESVSRDWKSESDRASEKLHALEQKELGTRDYMVAEAGRVADEVLHKELDRVDRMERQLGEIREALIGGEVRSGAETEQSLDITQASLLTTGDGLARVEELEQQILFLQSRMFEIGQAQSITPSTPAEAADRPLPLPQTLGELVARLQDPDPVERVGALYALANVSDVGVVAHVIPLLEDHDKYIRALAARSLERLAARSAVQSLLVALEDADPDVREAAVSAARAITEQQFLFDPRGPRDERREAVGRWRSWWKANWKAFLYGEE